MTGDPTRCRAFWAVLASHEPYLLRVARRLSRSVDDAADLVQRTFIRAFERCDGFEQGTDPRAWLTTILRHLFLDQVKHDRVVARAESDLMVLSPEDGCDLRTISHVTNEQLWEAAAQLPDRLREVIELKYRDGLSYRDIAARLGIASGTVGSRLSDALGRLRKLLA